MIVARAFDEAINGSRFIKSNLLLKKTEQNAPNSNNGAPGGECDLKQNRGFSLQQGQKHFF